MTITELRLTPALRAIAADFLTTFPSVVFISGLRDIESQANAMSDNCVLSPGFIRATYIAAPIIDRMADWVDDLTTPITAESVAAGLLSIMQAATPEELQHVSKHLPGADGLSHAFDCQPSSVSAMGVVWLQSRVGRAGGKVLTHENKLPRIHVQI